MISSKPLPHSGSLHSSMRRCESCIESARLRVLLDPVIRRASYLDHAALEAIDRVVHPLAGVPKLPGNTGHWKHTDDLAARLKELEPDDVARIRLEVDFARAVYNMYDTSIHAEQRI